MTDRHVAEKQVIDVLRMDVHLDYTADGKYYIERITEIVKLPEGLPYPEIDRDDLEYSVASIQREYYARKTDRKTFEVKDIIRYDLDTDTYYAVNPPSETLLQDMLNCMDKDKKDEFLEFLQKQFSYYKKKQSDLVENNTMQRRPVQETVANNQINYTGGMKKSRISRSDILG